MKRMRFLAGILAAPFLISAAVSASNAQSTGDATLVYRF